MILLNFEMDYPRQYLAENEMVKSENSSKEKIAKRMKRKG
jgi:hypothetical protein